MRTSTPPANRPREAVQSHLSHRLLTFAVWWAVLFGVWLVLVDSLARPEVAGGAIAAVPAAFLTYGVVTAKSGRFHVRLRWFRALKGVPAAVLRDSALLVPVLWRRITRGELPKSDFVAVRTPIHGGDPEAAAALRALSIIGTSLAPNTIVVGIEPERGIALVHLLIPQPPEQVRHAIVSAAPDMLDIPDAPCANGG